MNELILVLEENPEIQAVISASMKDSPIFINQELDPDYFLQQVQNLNPDLIFISNSENERNYSTCRKIREDPAIKHIPVILLVNAKDEIDEDVLKELQINGMLRKPFEAAMLKEQLSEYISLDENFGSEPDKKSEPFALDMSGINNDLKEIKQQNQEKFPMDSKGTYKTPDSLHKYRDSTSAASGSNMDSLVLEDIFIDNENQGQINNKEEILRDETGKINYDTELQIDKGNDFDLKYEDKIYENSYKDKLETHATESDLFRGGLEKLKLSGLEDKYAERKLLNENKEIEQKLRIGLTDIDLTSNNFDDPSDIWSHPPDLEQTQREGLTDISLDQTDFNPSFPKHLASLGGSSSTIRQEDVSGGEQISEMDNSLLQTGNEKSSHLNGNGLDDILLTDSEEKEAENADGIDEIDQFVVDSSLDEFDDVSIEIMHADDEINSMVKESIDDQEISSSETALEELEDLSLQMESLEEEEAELEAEEKQFENDLEKERILEEGIAADYQEEELTEFMVDELGDLLEIDEEEQSDDMEQDYSYASEINHALEEDVFVSWDEAEEAFTGFDKDSLMTEESLDKDYSSDREGRYSFNEDELKIIVTSSVQNALEKSIVSSLVELAVSEIKNNVSGRV